MISFCPACNTEQMVTAVALQSMRDRKGVQCCRCDALFNPRAHRLTPAKERAFKARLKEQQFAAEQAGDLKASVGQLLVEMDSTVEHSSDARPIVEEKQSKNGQRSRSSGSDNRAGHAIKVPLKRHPEKGTKQFADQLVKELGQTVSSFTDRLSTTVASKVSEFKKADLNQHTAQKETDDFEIKRQRVDQLRKKLQQNSERKKRPTRSQEHAARAKIYNKSSEVNHSVAMGHVDDDANFNRQLEHQKLKLEQQKLKIEREKIELERTRLALEKEKLELVKDRTAPQTLKDVARPIIEYDAIADILPRTPNAFDNRRAPRSRPEKVKLELMPVDENRRTLRRGPTK